MKMEIVFITVLSVFDHKKNIIEGWDYHNKDEKSIACIYVINYVICVV